MGRSRSGIPLVARRPWKARLPRGCNRATRHRCEEAAITKLVDQSNPSPSAAAPNFAPHSEPNQQVAFAWFSYLFFNISALSAWRLWTSSASSTGRYLRLRQRSRRRREANRSQTRSLSAIWNTLTLIDSLDGCEVSSNQQQLQRILVVLIWSHEDVIRESPSRGGSRWKSKRSPE